MTEAPQSQKLRRAIRELIALHYTMAANQVVFLDNDGEIREVMHLSEGVSVLRKKRADMLLLGELGAIVHLRAYQFQKYGQINLIETFESGESHVASMITWPVQAQWTKTDDQGSSLWTHIWREEE